MMPRPLNLLPVALLLSACGSSAPAPVPAPLSPQEQACAAQADQDPALQEARGISAGRLDWQWQHETQMTQVKRDAITRCLRARGLAPRGGVERPR